MRIDATYKTCGECGRHNGVETDTRIQCDVCETVVGADSHLDIKTFENTNNGTQVTDFEFCSWKCCFEKLRTIECNDFARLPYLQFDLDGPISYKAFLEAAKEFKG